MTRADIVLGRPPPNWGVALDGSVGRHDDGRLLLGGSPLRLLRLTAAGAKAVDDFVGGEPIGPSNARARLARRLFDGGLAHPIPNLADVVLDVAEVTVVVPVCDDAEGLAVTLASLARHELPGALSVFVVDDGSAQPVVTASGSIAGPVAADPAGALVPLRVQVLRRPAPGGPAVGRQHGLVRVDTPYVAFVDAGVTVPAGWLRALGAYFADPAIVAVAPRVASEAGDTVLERYEVRESPLDLGGQAARVAPRSRVAYVPTAMLLARTDALATVGGFDPGMRYGEDVDAIWRLVRRGGTVRYAPDVVAHHRPRRSYLALWRQRVGYGSAAAPLAARHPDAVPPVQVSGWSAAVWALVAAGHPLLGVAVAGTSTALLPRKLVGLADPWRRALQLAGRGHWLAGRWLARALLRPYWPIVVLAALVSRRARRVLLAAVVLPALADWRRDRPELDPLRFLALRTADDIAYATGVWLGCWRLRSAAALRPDLSSWPGRGRAEQQE